MRVNEIFGVTIQGEGILTGEPCIFVRLAGCNMSCDFCDTDHEHSTPMSVNDILGTIMEIGDNRNIVVITGGEPLIHDKTGHLIDLIMANQYFVQIETNGTLPLKEVNPHIVVCSPKVPPEEILLEKANCVKFIYPYIEGVTPDAFYKAGHHLIMNPNCVKFIQPVFDSDPKVTMKNIKGAVEEVKRLGCGYKLGLQIHKMIGEQ